jgi:hypothetical protein
VSLGPSVDLATTARTEPSPAALEAFEQLSHPCEFGSGVRGALLGIVAGADRERTAPRIPRRGVITGENT